MPQAIASTSTLPNPSDRDDKTNDVRATEPRQRVCPKTDEADRLVESQRRGLYFQDFVQWATAEYEQPCLSRPPRRCKANALSNVS